jgi:hypothetical protein
MTRINRIIAAIYRISPRRIRITRNRETLKAWIAEDGALVLLVGKDR